ncbi:hypothetical protein HME9302_00117 [Alteripontixanthobacter maritimus]|uniref:N-formylglutamate deformylase n=1 Tax=Alteripontixanthobacter maritimus TaxID=2161824 RepID=A0A369Q1Z9_9SPHN|nr:hypothetical protein HME9302_00117 [Alteripontixanthobacter maritimus]
MIGNRSRFEFDLNRGEDDAVYRTLQQSWGLKVWHQEPDDELVEKSLNIHRAFYRTMGSVLSDVSQMHPRFVVLDVHSYNHRRDGQGGADRSERRSGNPHRYILDAAQILGVGG